MIVLNKTQLLKIKEHSLSCYPEEMCGGLTIDDFIPFTNKALSKEEADSKNISNNRLNSFSIASIELVPYLNKLTAIVHSHCRDKRKPEILDTRTPSLADILGQKESGLPWLIVSTEGEVVTPAIQLPREPSNNYIGRPFIWFINDCYTLVQDYYKFELGINLPDHKANTDYKSLRIFDNIFDNYIAEYKFEASDDLKNMKNGDLILLDNGGKKRNHLGIYHNGKIIHQDLLSVEVPFETFIGRINKVLRYVG